MESPLNLSDITSLDYSKLIFREAIPFDIPQLVYLTKDLGYTTDIKTMEMNWENFNNKETSFVFVLSLLNKEKEEKILAYASLIKIHFIHKSDIHLRLLSFVVNQKFQGQGLGHFFLNQIEKWALALKHVHSIELTSSKWREKNKTHIFYQKNGYEEIGNKQNFFIKNIL